MSDLDLNEIERLADAATPHSWYAYRMTLEGGDLPTPQDIAEYVRNSVEASAKESGTEDFLFVLVTKPDGPADVCHVGNGPTSPANAAYIARMDPPTTKALVARCREAEAAAHGWGGDVDAIQRTVRKLDYPESPKGDTIIDSLYEMHSQYAQLQARVPELEAERDSAQRRWAECDGHRQVWLDVVTRCKAELSGDELEEYCPNWSGDLAGTGAAVARVLRGRRAEVRKLEARCELRQAAADKYELWYNNQLERAQKAEARVRELEAKTDQDCASEAALRAYGDALEKQAAYIAELEAERSAIVAEAEKRLRGDAVPMTVEEMSGAHDWLKENAPPDVLKYITGWQVGIWTKDQRITRAEAEVRRLRERVRQFEEENAGSFCLLEGHGTGCQGVVDLQKKCEALSD